jgi:hypothetical protein
VKEAPQPSILEAARTPNVVVSEWLVVCSKTKGEVRLGDDKIRILAQRRPLQIIQYQHLQHDIGDGALAGGLGAVRWVRSRFQMTFWVMLAIVAAVYVFDHPGEAVMNPEALS